MPRRPARPTCRGCPRRASRCRPRSCSPRTGSCASRSEASPGPAARAGRSRPRGPAWLRARTGAPQGARRTASSSAHAVLAREDRCRGDRVVSRPGLDPRVVLGEVGVDAGGVGVDVPNELAPLLAQALRELELRGERVLGRRARDELAALVVRGAVESGHPTGPADELQDQPAILGRHPAGAPLRVGGGLAVDVRDSPRVAQDAERRRAARLALRLADRAERLRLLEVVQFPRRHVAA